MQLLRNVFAALALVSVLAPSVRAQGTGGALPSADELKVAFLVNFMKFIQWPATAFSGPSAPLTLGIIGHDPFERLLDLAVERKTIDGRPVQVKRLSDTDDFAGIQLVFIGEDPERGMADLLRRLDKVKVLTISDTHTFCADGGVIGFIVEHDRLRFDINAAAARRRGLTVSSKLLAVARVVYED